MTSKFAYISIRELRFRAEHAFQQGIEVLLARTIPSQWESDGNGWQELWDTALRAGVYASCDGLLLLDIAAKHGVPETVIEEQRKRTLDQHLVPIFDVGRVPPSKLAERTRTEATTISMKPAKLLQAACTFPLHDTQRDFIRRVIRMMYRNGYIRDGLWAPAKPLLSQTEIEARVSATVEALLAISRLSSRPTSSARRSLQQLHEIALQPTAPWRRRLISFWGISELGQWIDNDDLKGVAASFRDFLLDSPLPEQAEIKAFFNNPQAGGYGDYISYCPELLLAITAVNFIRFGLLGVEVLHQVCPIITDVTSQILDTGVYRSRSTETTHFWEFYQAMMLLDRFSRATYPLHLLEVELMYINPRFFRNKNVKPNDKLCAILMPFKETWSDDVFAAYQDAVTSAGFVPWRSDQEWGDHEIMQLIWENINKARFVIADCTGRNPNVFYELGIAHTIGKPVFICTQKRRDIPFDIQHITSVVYSTLPSGIQKLQKAITNFTTSVTT